MRMADTIRLLLAFTGLAASSRAHLSVCDDEQRLLRIDYTVLGDSRAQFEYDALGRLIYSWTQLDPNTGDSDVREVWYYHDGGEAIAEYEPLGGGNLKLLRRHIHGTARVDERAVRRTSHCCAATFTARPGSTSSRFS